MFRPNIGEFFETCKNLSSYGIALAWVVIMSQLTGADEVPRHSLVRLGSNVFREREKAQSDLLDWGRLFPDSAKKNLFDQTLVSQDPEVRIRCMEVLRCLVIDDYLQEGSGYIGVALSGEMLKIPQDPNPRGVIRITQVQPNTPASRAGIHVGDFIVGLDGRIWYKLNAMTIFLECIKAMKPTTKVELQVLRNGAVIKITVSLMRRPVVINTLGLFNQQGVDAEGAETAAKEDYFRQWLESRNLRK